MPPKTWSPSSGNNKTLPNTPRVPAGGKSCSISFHQGQEEGAHEPANPPNEETSGQDRQLLAMVHETINAPVDQPSSDIDQVLSVNRANTRTLKTSYIFTKPKTNLSLHQLINRGANGGLEGSDMRVLNHTGCKINIVGTDSHELTGLDVVTAASLLDTNQGKVIGIFKEYAFLGKGSSIHSPGQMECFKTKVDDKSIKVGVKQRLETWEGYAVPIIFKDGLAYIKSLGRPNDQELETYPHVFFTSPDTWEPSLIDHEFSPEDEITWSQLQDTRPLYDSLFDAQCDLKQRIIATLNIILDLPDHTNTSIFNINSTSWHSLPHHSLPSDVDWEALKPYFGWAPIPSIQNTFKVIWPWCFNPMLSQEAFQSQKSCLQYPQAN